MRFQYFLFLFVFSLSAQNNPIEIKIDSIISKDSSEFSDREFIINYHIENVSHNEVSFFLNTKNFIPSTYSSMQYVTTYRLFQNENPIDGLQIITGKRINSQLNEKDSNTLTKYRDSIRLHFQKNKSDPLYYWKESNTAILSSIFTLKPKEIKPFTRRIYWNKSRYSKNGELEYYFDENSIYTFQIQLTLLKEEYKDRLTQKELESIVNNPNFLKGYFYSNKVEINFKD